MAEKGDFFKVEWIDYDYWKEAEKKWREFVRISFYKWLEEIKSRFWHSHYMKNGNPTWLHFDWRNDSIKVSDFTQKWHKIYELTLSYDKEKDSFSLKEVKWVDQKVWNDVGDDEILKFLDNIKEKIEVSDNGVTLDKTRMSAQKAISDMFNDKKNRIFKF
jgi:hypothetical protein